MEDSTDDYEVVEIFDSTITEQQIQDESLLDKLKNISTNLRFNLTTYTFQNGSANYPLKEIGDSAVILSKKVYLDSIQNNIEKQNQQLYGYLSKISWFTYRRNFPVLLSNYQQDEEIRKYTSDTGWGCMLRVGQMALCEALKNYLNKANKKYQLKDLIQLFNDNSKDPTKSPFSIQNIAEEAYLQFNLEAGEEYKSSTILIAFEQILKKYNLIQRSKLNINFKSLTILNFYDGLINFQDIKKIAEQPVNEDYDIRLSQDYLVLSLNSSFIANNQYLSDKQLNDKIRREYEVIDKRVLAEINEEETKTHKKIINFDRQQEIFKNVKKEFNQLPWEKSIVINIFARLGISKPDNIYQEIIIDLLNMKNTIGILGGKPRFAFYIVGYKLPNFELIYLDPHYVQDSCQTDYMDDKLLKTYTCSKMKYLKYQDLDPCLAVSFYVHDYDDFCQFMGDLKTLAEKHKENLFIGLVNDINDLELSNGTNQRDSQLSKQSDLQSKQSNKSLISLDNYSN